MKRPQFPATLLCALLLLSCNRFSAAAEPLHGLILTSPGVYHNYEYQTPALAAGIAGHVNIRFDVSLAERERWKNTDYGVGYDVLVYNICMADDTDPELIANMRRQTEEVGVPTVVLHCSMHSFRNTDLWWPMFGLRTTAHEPLGPMQLKYATDHAVLAGIPADWELEEDELYINLDFEAQPLLSAPGRDGETHTTAWVTRSGATPVFGTTLGHSDSTIENPAYQRLVANGILFVTGGLMPDGTTDPRYQPASGAVYAIDEISAGPGMGFLGQQGQDCAFREMGLAIGPCYLGCILNPFEWGAKTEVCKKDCESGLPSADELIARCMPAAETGKVEAE